MKIGFFSESPGDQAALAIFAEGILGEAPEPINMSLEGHCVSGVMNALDGVIRGVHYNSDADGLVVVVDCDDTELHTSEHESPGGASDRCRLCTMRKKIARALNQLKPIGGRILKVAAGLTVPAIEAWYLVGVNHEVGEAAWITGCAANKRPFTRPQLKQQIYGTDRPSLEHETDCAVKHARRIISDIKRIEDAFPMGFGRMATEIRSWKAS